MTQKIKAEKEWSFFQAYNNNNYILRHDCSTTVSLHEKGENRKYILHNNPKNKKEIIIYKIDGGLIDNNRDLKCDYGIYTEDDLLFLIELKGANLDHALDQINNTIKILLKQPIKVKKLNVRIVLSKVRTPDIYATKEKKLMQSLLKFYGGDYKRKSRILEEKL